MSYDNHIKCPNLDIYLKKKILETSSSLVMHFQFCIAECVFEIDDLIKYWYGNYILGGERGNMARQEKYIQKKIYINNL